MTYRSLNEFGYALSLFNIQLTRDLFGVKKTYLTYKADDLEINNKLTKDLSNIVPNVKQNVVYNLSLRRSDGTGHANLIIIDYANREIYRWDPHGPTQFLPIEKKIEVDDIIFAVAVTYGYKFNADQACRSAPQIKESRCAHRTPFQKSGFCSYYSVVFALLYMRSHMTYQQLDEELSKLIDRDPCVMFSLFAVFNDIGVEWYIKAFPAASVLLDDSVENVDNNTIHYVAMDTIQRNMEKNEKMYSLDRKDQNIILTQIDLILVQFKEMSYASCANEKVQTDKYKKLYEQQDRKFQEQSDSNSNCQKLFKEYKELMKQNQQEHSQVIKSLQTSIAKYEVLLHQKDEDLKTLRASLRSRSTKTSPVNLEGDVAHYKSLSEQYRQLYEKQDEDLKTLRKLLSSQGPSLNDFARKLPSFVDPEVKMRSKKTKKAHPSKHKSVEGKKSQTSLHTDRETSSRIKREYVYFNPETGRIISKDGPTYLRLLQMYTKNEFRRRV